jgi:hypothetical protein
MWLPNQTSRSGIGEWPVLWHVDGAWSFHLAGNSHHSLNGHSMKFAFFRAVFATFALVSQYAGASAESSELVPLDR